MGTNLKIPENLSIAQLIRDHRNNKTKYDFDYHAFVLGQSPFPVPEPIQMALKKNTHQGMYGSSTGLDALKQAFVNFNKYHYDLDIKADKVFVSNGTKMLIYMLVHSLNGTFILPTPSWVGYEPILKLLKKKYIKVRLKAENNYKLDIHELALLMDETEDPILILNNPHNPSGSLLSDKDLEKISQICKKHDAFVIADEIYGLLSYNNQFVSMYKHYPEKTFVTQGISKDRSAAGYRLGICILPLKNSEYFMHQLNALASIMYTNVSTPIQHAAVEAYSFNNEINEYISTIRSIHKMVGEYFSRLANTDLNLKASVPEGAFYLLIDFNDLKEALNNSDIKTAKDLSMKLLAEPYHVAVVMGSAISLDETDLLARLALVDYDGKKVFESYKLNPPRSLQEEEMFMKKHMKHMIDGFTKIKSFIDTIKKPL